MANDRVYLRCKKCGSIKMFIKYYPMRPYAADGKSIEDWLELHLDKCYIEPVEDPICNNNLGDNTLFDLITEGMQ